MLVPRALRIEVTERVRHDGRVEKPQDEAEVRAAARELGRAIGRRLLYSYVDPRHEMTARRIVEEECPGAFVSCAHEVAPEFRRDLVEGTISERVAREVYGLTDPSSDV